MRRHAPALVALPSTSFARAYKRPRRHAASLSKEDADYCIDKAVATGVLDSAGDLNFIARGNREEIIAEILHKGATWKMPVSRDEAERLTNQAVRGNKLRRRSRIFWTVALVAIAYLIASALGR